MKAIAYMLTAFDLALFLLLLTLKLCDKIQWSWFWVAAPLWVGCIIALIALGVMIVGLMYAGPQG